MSKNFSYSNKPSIHHKRSQFPLGYNYSTMFNLGEIIPVYCQEVLPGDTFNVSSNFVIRTTSPFVRPMFGNLFCDVHYFFVPNRIIDNHFEELMGDNKTDYWAPSSTGKAPEVTGSVGKNTIADYFGLAPKNYETIIPDNPVYVNEHRLRAYAQIWNDWYRCEALQAPVLINKSTGKNKNGKLNSNDWSTSNFLGKPAKACKIYDYFTGCLLAPQRGQAVMVKGSQNIPVDSEILTHSINENPWHFSENVGGPLYSNESGHMVSDPEGFTGEDYTKPDNIWAMADNMDLFSISDLRFATQLQKSLELDARAGGRYIEQIYAKFGVISPDARLQRSELLGGFRFPLNLSQVTQTSKSESSSPLGQVGAFSLSNGSSGFSKGFVEHGFIIGLAVIRQQHTYQNSLEKSWMRFDRYDYYEPLFANISEQPVYSYEIDVDNIQQRGNLTDVFGYNEAWADYRYHPNQITGALRSSADDGFDIWHIADDYSTYVSAINSSWIQETPVFLDRTLSVPSTTAPQFLVDCYHDVKAIRVMPVHSIPGKMDH